MMVPLSMFTSNNDEEENTLLRFFLVFTILISTKVANAQDDQVYLTLSDYEPSLFVVMGVLSLMLSIIFLLLIYAKWCYHASTATHNHNNANMAMFSTHTRFSGLDVKVIESLPFFKFSSLEGAKKGLQCSVCLAEFEDVEMIKLLPKCKHGFHIDCIDKWLENHSTCPLCRQKVDAEDITLLINSNSTRLIMEGSVDLEDVSSCFELFIEREDDQTSSRFSIGSSFRNVLNSNKEEIVTMQMQVEACNLHRLNHRILVSNAVFKNRWSDVRPSDLMLLNSEMLGIMSSERFSSSKSSFDEDKHMLYKPVVEGSTKMFENGLGKVKRCSSNSSSKIDMGFDDSRVIRAMSEITGVSRFKNLINGEKIVKKDVINRRKWFTIAKRTVNLFANRENNRSRKQTVDNFVNIV